MSAPSIENLLLTIVICTLAGCAAPPPTPEQKALNKAYDAISASKAGSVIKK